MTHPASRRALRFVLLVGVMSFFADFTYEGARAIVGPYLALLGASGTAVGVVSGLGEGAGYGLRLISGRAADRTRWYWPIAIVGYVIQMVSVPALALARSWPAAAVLLALERVGRAVRNPPRDVMLSHAGKEMGGYGWTFGLHEALDQFGAVLGPLAMALILARHLEYRLAFASLTIPALVTLAMLTVARVLYPRPEAFEPSAPHLEDGGLPRVFWTYLAAAALVSAGYADFPLVAFHFQRTGSVPQVWVPLVYAIAMGAGGVGSLAFGRLFDRIGLRVLLPLTALSALFAPLVFLGGLAGALAGGALWGLGMGVHESIVPAAVAPMVPPERRGTAYGIFTSGYGLSWLLGSALIGWAYDKHVTAAVAICVVLQLAALPFIVLAARAMDREPG